MDESNTPRWPARDPELAAWLAEVRVLRDGAHAGRRGPDEYSEDWSPEEDGLSPEHAELRRFARRFQDFRG